MKKYKERILKNHIEDLGDIWAKNWLAIELDLRNPIPNQKNMDAGKFNMADCERQIKQAKEILKGLE